MTSIASTLLTTGLMVVSLLAGFEHASASQGPGVAAGAASTTVQLAMAIIVYGGSAVLLAAGLIGAARQRKAQG